jgi:ubiquinone/menaquinone biosynthesis C-methylase UbiE
MRKDKHHLVKKAYGDVARKQSSCCGPKPSCCDKSAVIPDHPVPEAELGLSCGNPVAFSHLRKGDVVLDLGSGAGKDVFLAAEKVGPKGKAIGVDMTPEMLDLARKNAEKFRASTGLSNVEFREGQIEKLPLEDATVDVVISNCVINLSPDKPRVFREAFRALRPGGRLIVSDIVLNRPLPRAARENEGLYSSCIAGALLRDEYLKAVADAGFQKIAVLADHRREVSDVRGDPITSELKEELAGAASSVTIMAEKPAGCCCGKRC